MSDACACDVCRPLDVDRTDPSLCVNPNELWISDEGVALIIRRYPHVYGELYVDVLESGSIAYGNNACIVDWHADGYRLLR